MNCYKEEPRRPDYHKISVLCYGNASKPKQMEVEELYQKTVFRQTKDKYTYQVIGVKKCITYISLPEMWSVSMSNITCQVNMLQLSRSRRESYQSSN